ncbi:hypothetical protein Q428_06050 [Fervidicella metallireducens AeB]|uniref:Flagellar hook capping protein n=1 Tax=Fervidicella metallireducens AeB TaxID=1403537 RepID=A0A017RY06_9CLOT|nr:hypothetical protein Q428_06050 [Fervidicella metallireducens AeB]
MGVTGVTNKNVEPQNYKGNNLDKNAFLKILTVQLKNQDPQNAKDNTEYIAQMAQFSALEQSQNLNQTMEKLLAVQTSSAEQLQYVMLSLQRQLTSQNMTEATSLIGKKVEILLEKDNSITEQVKGVKVIDGDVFVITDNGKYSINNVIGVGEFSSDR